MPANLSTTSEDPVQCRHESDHDLDHVPVCLCCLEEVTKLPRAFKRCHAQWQFCFRGVPECLPRECGAEGDHCRLLHDPSSSRRRGFAEECLRDSRQTAKLPTHEHSQLNTEVGGKETQSASVGRQVWLCSVSAMTTPLSTWRSNTTSPGCHSGAMGGAFEVVFP